MIWRLGLAFVVAVLVVASPRVRGADGEMPFGRVHVISVGVEDYANTPNFRDLAFAVDDAEGVSDVLESRYGYTTQTLVDRGASRDAVYAAIDSASRALMPDDVLIFFFAGHGSNKQHLSASGAYRGYLIPWIPEDLMASVSESDITDEAKKLNPFVEPGPPLDESGKPAEVGGELHEKRIAEALADWKEARLKEACEEKTLGYAIPMVELRERLMAVRCRHVVLILDACFSGLSGTRSGDPIEEAEAKAKLLSRYFDAQRQSRSVLTAGTGDQEALEHNAKARGGFPQINDIEPKPDGGIPHGVFTYELLYALENVDSEGISLSELHAMIASRVTRVAIYYRDILGNNSLRMTPQLREFSESESGPGSFVFIPKPEKTWLDLVFDEAYEAAKGKFTGVTDMRSAEGQEVLEKMRVASLESAELRAARAKLDSKALITLAFQASMGMENGDGSLSRDPIWVARYEEAFGKASSGDGDAMAALFYMYAYGLGVEPSPSEAGRWASEAAGSESADAKLAYRKALTDGIGIDATEAEREAVAEQAAKNAETTQQLAAVGAVLAVAQATGNDDLQKASGIGAAFAAALILTDRLAQDEPEETIPQTIARIQGDVQALGTGMREWQTKGRVDSALYERVRGSLPGLTTRIVRLAREEQAMAPDKTVLRFTEQAAREVVNELRALQRPWGRTSPAAYADAQDHFDRFERAYARLVALLPYIEFESNWSEG